MLCLLDIDLQEIIIWFKLCPRDYTAQIFGSVYNKVNCTIKSNPESLQGM